MNTENLDSKQNYLVITGGSSGIGLQTAQKFSASGYRVINLSRKKIPLDDAIQLTTDLAKDSWCEQVIDVLKDELRNATSITLVHNAAVLYKDAVDDLATINLQKALQVNVVAAVQLNQIILPLMKPGSSILYLGSTLSEKAVANTCSYVISKHAVLGLMRATVQDLSGREIHSACVCPGFTDTEMLRAHVGGNPEVLEDIASNSTFNRLVMPKEIADTLYFCATNPAINGVVLHANLGQIEH